MAVVDSRLPARVLGDAARLRQILLNLGGNAVKFTEHGEVVIDADVVEQLDGRARLRISVRDTGIGIPRERRDLLFQRFSQVDASSTRRHGGTGLGLSIVKRLAELMGGTVGVESTEGVGSTFWFTFGADIVDATEPAPAPEPLTAPSAHAAGSVRILLAEDNEVNQKVARRLLEKAGYSVDVAVDGRDAIDAWRRGGHDLILMDCQMPLLDGYEATREIRRLESEHGAGERIPIIALTAHAMNGAAEECLAAGMDAHLAKPLDRAQLLAELERRLREPPSPALRAASP